MSFSTLLYQPGEIAVITLNRPEARNALNEQTGDEFQAVCREIAASKNTRVLLVCGAGDAFSAGGDMQFLRDRCDDTPANNKQRMLAFYDRFLAVRQLTVPTIAVIEGAAVGAGLCLAVACDFRVAAAGVKLGFNFVQLGLHPGMGASFLLPQVIGRPQAERLLLGGEIISSEEALRIGLVHQLTEKGQARTAADAWAVRLAAAAPGAVARTKSTLRQASDAPLRAALDNEAHKQAIDYAGRDLREGIVAFFDKRRPQFTGE